jgi:hypothetical protein
LALAASSIFRLDADADHHEIRLQMLACIQENACGFTVSAYYRVNLYLLLKSHTVPRVMIVEIL